MVSMVSGLRCSIPTQPLHEDLCVVLSTVNSSMSSWRIITRQVLPVMISTRQHAVHQFQGSPWAVEQLMNPLAMRVPT